jgi:hypothetical protein
MLLDKRTIKDLEKILEIETVSPFRAFAMNVWQDHKDEVFYWESRIVEYTSKQYFAENKWYLKKLYKSTPR